MNHLNRMYRLAPLALPCLLFACATSHLDKTADTQNDPGRLYSYCSPFTDTGELVPWAKSAIDHGVGLEFRPAGESRPDVRPYPDNTPWPHNARRYPAGASGENRHIIVSAPAVRAVGGINYIEDSSVNRYGTIDELALALYGKHREHPRFAEALAAAMKVYPALRERYYLISNSPHHVNADAEKH